MHLLTGWIFEFQSDKKDMILINTTRFDTMILTCELNADGLTYDIITKAHGNFKDTVPRQSSIHMITAVDSTTKSTPLIAIKCYDGILKTIQLFNDSKQLNVSTMRSVKLSSGHFCSDPSGQLLLLCLEWRT